MAECRECGGTFDVPRKPGVRPQFCSPDCRKSHRKRYYAGWVQANRDYVLAETAIRRNRFKERNPDYWRRHYEANRERRKQHRIEWYRKNAERALETAKRYAEQNRERIRAISRKSRQTRRARMLDAFVETIDALRVFDRDGGICGICGRSVDPDSRWHVDHVVPLSRGGLHSYDNVQLAHGTCNRKKGAKTVEHGIHRDSPKDLHVQRGAPTQGRSGRL